MAHADLILTPDAHAPSKAREFLAEVLADQAGSEWLASAQLALSEVVTNAVRHGFVGSSGSLRLSFERTDGLIRIRVTQPGPVPERPTIVSMPDPWSTSGYGLGVVDAVAHRWGVQLDPPSVWFEMHREDH
jgi:anti-sigma regulatory factor (Ser/Thr protein kinase)